MTLTRLLRCSPGTCFVIASLFAPFQSMADTGSSAANVQHSDAQLDAILTVRAQEILDRMGRLEGQSKDIRVQVIFDFNAGAIQVHFGPGMLPDDYGASFEDQHDAFRHGLTHVAQKAAQVKEITFRYQGREIEAYFPEVRREAEDAQRARERRSQGGHAFVSASHGYYYHHGWRRWALQRDQYHGVQEDFITPQYADELQKWLARRGSGVVTTRPRSLLTEIQHPEAMQPWWQMAARYSVKERFPENPKIWNSKGDRIYPTRDYDEDINSRPLMANHVGAGVALHLHTNGADDTAASGARAVVQPGRPDDLLLGRSILCYMKELIQSAEGYGEFSVGGEPFQVDKGENRLSEMPSIIVEMGFHTNPADAAALQDSVFRTASMKGVEKGYRLFREGKGCLPLKAEPIPGINLSQGDSQQVDVVFEGYPQYPIELVTTNVGCPPGWTCTDGRVHIEALDAKPSQITLRCENAGSAPIFWDTQVVDDDGVKSPPVRHWVQCTRRPGGAVARPAVSTGVEAATAG
ncbi:N-acetylmuramoyl-L-alanine amidase [Stenotrophomonas lactitubi]|uniref:N-acetylmuramoyl-L-alanine amidase family protein n=1 Tax=Stenotrophomonas lactitubi TaxID=2045214 RepID=UPI00320AABD3